jgi:hypothetical protein
VSASEAVGALVPEPDPGPDTVEAAVRAELEHHLACAAQDLIADGHAPEAARREAARRFGDLEAVRRECVRIQTRGDLMRKRLHLALTTVLALGVAYLVLAQRQTTMRARLEAEHARELAAQLQDRLQERQRPGPVEHIVIGVGDELGLVDFTQSNTLYLPGNSMRVAADGKVLVPDVGWIHVAGLTREEAEARLTEALAPYHDGIDVKVIVTSAGEPR